MGFFKNLFKKKDQGEQPPAGSAPQAPQPEPEKPQEEAPTQEPAQE